VHNSLSLGLTILLVAPLVAKAEPQAFVAKYCIACHDSASPEAGLDLVSLPRDLANAEHFRRWIKVHDRVSAGEMPPKSADQPTAEERQAFARELHDSLLAAEQARPPQSRLRRLTRAEYENTIRDLFEMPGIALAGSLPADGSAGGFDKHAEALDISHVNLAKYLEAADHILNYAIATRPAAPSIQRRRISLVNRGGFVAHVVMNGDGVLLKDGQPEPGFPPSGEQGHIDQGAHERMGSFETGSSVGLFRHEDESFNPYFIEHVTIYPGVYRVRTSLWSFQWDKGAVLPGRGTEAGRLSVVQLTGDGRGGQHPSYVLGYFNAPFGAAQEHELGVWLNLNEIIGFNTASLAPAANYYKKLRAMEFTGPGIVCDWLDIEGPLHEVWPPRSHQLLFGDLPLQEFKAEEHTGTRPSARLKVRQLGAGQNRPDPEPGVWTVRSDAPLEDANRLLAAFLPKLFRRPVDDETRQQYVQLVKERLDSGDCFEMAMRSAYKIALCSPDFLYHIEPSDSPGDYAVACRLSYLLWNSLPDERLAQHAASGDLRQPSVLAAEIERLLAHPRSQRFVEDFLGQWLKLRQIAANDPDKKLYPEFSPYLQDAMVAETRAYFRELLDQNLDASHLVKSPFAMINEKLAVHYGVAGVSGAQLRRVDLPADCPRGGFLTQASILKITANGTTTSPVPRGAFVMDRLLGQPPEPPPSNVAAIEPDVRGATTIREQLAKHREHTVCASCHSQIDPPGFALEAFDVIGGFRERYRSIGEGDAAPRGSIDPFIGISFKLGPRVDASGQLADGTAFKGVQEYRSLLAEDASRLLRNLAQQLVVYATGREIRYSDRPAMDDIVRRTQTRGGGLRTLLHEVVQSPLFTGKATERPRDDKPPAFAAAQFDQQASSRMMMTSALPTVGPTAQYISTVIPAPEPPAAKPTVIDDTNTITLRVIGLFDVARGDELQRVLRQMPEVKLMRLDRELAEVTLAYDPNCDLLKGAKPDQLIERINNRLRDLTRHTMGLKALSDIPRDKLERVEIAIRGLDCQACCLAAYEALAQTEGVEQATASFRAGIAVAWIDPAKTNRAALETALERRGVTIARPEAK
jgi:hypothetical protein